MLAKLNIEFDNGNAGFVVGSSDGVFGLVAHAVAVSGTFELEKAYKINSMQDVAKLGILPDVNNHVLHRTLVEFFSEAGQGTRLWLMGMPKTIKVSEWFASDKAGNVPIRKMLDKANGTISCVFTKAVPMQEPVIKKGMDTDVVVAMANAQRFADDYTQLKYSPFFVLLEAYGFNGNEADLPNLTEDTKNRVAVFIGDTAPKTNSNSDITKLNHNQANQVLAGRLAAIQVHENAGKVKLGSLNTSTAFIDDMPVEFSDVESLHNKGYISFRTHIRKAGYYITDDPLATGFNDDYHYITRRRVIDKAYKIAYNVGINEVLENFDLLPDGTLSPFYAKAVENSMETAIYELMGVNGELSIDPNDPNDLGVKARFDRTQNVAQTGITKLSLKVRPKGHNRWFKILLGYEAMKN